MSLLREQKYAHNECAREFISRLFIQSQFSTQAPNSKGRRPGIFVAQGKRHAVARRPGLSAQNSFTLDRAQRGEQREHHSAPLLGLPPLFMKAFYAAQTTSVSSHLFFSRWSFSQSYPICSLMGFRPMAAPIEPITFASMRPDKNTASPRSAS